MVPHTVFEDTSAIEKGIDAVPETNGIFLAWYPLNDRNITKYNIYRKSSDDPFAYFRPIKTIDIESATAGKDTTFIDGNTETGLPTYMYHYYFVTAVNKDGLEGQAGDTLRYMLLPKPELNRPDGEIYDISVDGLPVLQWSFIDENPNLYILQIENSWGILHYKGVFRRDFNNDAQTLDLSTVVDLPELTPGDYRWRIDSIGPEDDDSGSESVPKVFTIK
ncbi:MAG: hypothetical protein E4H13_11605 [Calditrichales bacterium]|nr:MAG: hypothetical protein E4H13_11605 [Calditrichales bacterium]